MTTMILLSILSDWRIVTQAAAMGPAQATFESS
jgi:hypothetical protein